MKLDGNTGTEVSEADLIIAAEILASYGAFGAIDRLDNKLAEGNLSPALTAAYQTAKDDLESQRSFAGWVSNIFAGISLSSILLLMALGLAITFGLMGVINMAHGEMLMIGCVTTWACYEFIGTQLSPEWFNWYYVLALPISFGAAALVGIICESLILRHLYKRPS